MVENNNTVTETTVVNKSKELLEEELIEVRYPLFIMFAEYLGYVSPLLEWAEKLCMGTDIESFKRNILRVDAKSILTKILEECPREDVIKLFQDYYDLILGEYDEKLIKLEKSRKDDLPF